MQSKLPIFKHIAGGGALPFPSDGKQAYLTLFTYSATRMGKAPHLSGELLWDTCLDDEWSEDVCVEFRGIKYFLNNTPESTRSNVSSQYSHLLDFVSEYEVLEQTHLVNMDTGTPQHVVTNNATFSFFGNVNEFAIRFQNSLDYSGLGIGGLGYQIVVDTNTNTDKEILLSFDNTTLYDALVQMNESYGEKFYIEGKTIHIGDSNNILLPTPISRPTFAYGIDRNLISITKNNLTEKIINRCTGFGSDQNLPYFYPNETPNGLFPVYNRNGEVLQSAVTIEDVYKITRFTDCPRLEFTNIEDEHSELVNEIYRTTGYSYSTNSSRPTNPRQATSNVYYNTTSSRPFRLLDPTKDGFVYETYSSVIPTGGLEENDLFNRYRFTFNHILANPTNRVVFSPLTLTPSETRDYEDILRIGEISISVRCYEQGTDNFTESVYYDNTSSRTTWLSLPITFNIPEHNTYVYDRVFITIQFRSADNPKYNRQTNETLPQWMDTTTSVYFSNTFVKECLYCKITTFTEHLGWKNTTSGIEVLRLSDFGINLSVSPTLGDSITCIQRSALPTSTRLLPPIFYETDGREIFYNAIDGQYTIPSNPRPIDFENDHRVLHNNEEILSLDDIKPTIEKVRNAQGLRIDKILAYETDINDSNAFDPENEGTYLHPYFYVRIPQTNMADGSSFNLFSSGSDSGAMTISFTSGLCGGCNFEIGVLGDAGNQYNPVRVFTQDDVDNGRTDGYGRRGNVGDLWRDANGNVVRNATRGQCPTQQDTRTSSVWIALKKSNEEYGEMMPTGTIAPTTGDTFVITNISLPLAYIRAAEKRLEEAIIEHLKDNNSEKFGFTIRLSRIYYKENIDALSRINENSKIWIEYNGKLWSGYVDSFSYSFQDGSFLPDITFSTKEEVKIVTSRKRIARLIGIDAEVNDTPIEEATLSPNMAGEVHITSPLVVSSDIVLPDNNTLQSRLQNIDQSIRVVEERNTPATIFSQISSRINTRNLFRDGAFKYNFNPIKCTNGGTITLTPLANTRSNRVNINLPSETTRAEMMQQVETSSLQEHTLSLSHVQTLGKYFNVYVRYYNNVSGEISEEKIKVEQRYTSEVERSNFVLKTPLNADYFTISFGIDKSMDASNTFSIQDLVVLDTAFPEETPDGVKANDILTPHTFVPHTDDVDLLKTTSLYYEEYPDTQIININLNEQDKIHYVVLTDGSISSRQISVSTALEYAHSKVIIQNNTSTGISIGFKATGRHYKPKISPVLGTNECVVVEVDKTKTSTTFTASATLAMSKIVTPFGYLDTITNKIRIFANVDGTIIKAFSN